MITTPEFSPARLGRVADTMRGHIATGKVAGVVALVSRGDEIHVDALGLADLDSGMPMRRDTIFRIASMTKPVTAVAAMILVEEGKIKLDDPVDRWLPELADRKVLRTLESEPGDTVPANRAITLRDLLTFRLGFGAIMAKPGTYPIQAVIEEAGLAPGPIASALTPDAWIARFATLPLLHQPGQKWMYHTGFDVLGVLVARVAGMSLRDFFQERIFSPLGMADTGFFVPEDKIDRLAVCYQTDPATASLTIYDEARDGAWSRPPSFEAGGGGLVSTVDDFHAFGRMFLNGGRQGAERILSTDTVQLMMTDQMTPEQKAVSPFFPGFWDVRGWGLGAAVVTAPNSEKYQQATAKRLGIALDSSRRTGPAPGSFTWDGGFGTTWCSDPVEDAVTIFMIQRMMAGPDDYQINSDFWALAYQAL